MDLSDYKELHPDDVKLWLCVEKAAWRLIRASRAPVAFVRPVPRSKVNRLAGQFDSNDDTLYICLRKKWDKKTGLFTERLELHYIYDTLAHEVAHAKAGWEADHGGKFFRWFAKMILLSEKLGLRKVLAEGFEK